MSSSTRNRMERFAFLRNLFFRCLEYSHHRQQPWLPFILDTSSGPIHTSESRNSESCKVDANVCVRISHQCHSSIVSHPDRWYWALPATFTHPVITFKVPTSADVVPDQYCQCLKRFEVWPDICMTSVDRVSVSHFLSFAESVLNLE